MPEYWRSIPFRFGTGICAGNPTFPAKLECGHEFHTGCIWKALIMKNLCPLCRRVINVQLRASCLFANYEQSPVKYIRKTLTVDQLSINSLCEQTKAAFPTLSQHLEYTCNYKSVDNLECLPVYYQYPHIFSINISVTDLDSTDRIKMKQEIRAAKHRTIINNYVRIRGQRISLLIPEWQQGFMDNYARIEATIITAYLIRESDEGMLLLLEQPFCIGQIVRYGPTSDQNLIFVSTDGTIHAINEYEEISGDITNNIVATYPRLHAKLSPTLSQLTLSVS